LRSSKDNSQEDRHTAPSAWYIDPHIYILRLSLGGPPGSNARDGNSARMTERSSFLLWAKCDILETRPGKRNEFCVTRSTSTGADNKADVTSRQVEEAYQMMYAVDEYEQIGDVLSVNLMDKAVKWCTSIIISAMKEKRNFGFFVSHDILSVVQHSVAATSTKPFGLKIKNQLQPFPARVL
jgi:hypothetical protein